MRIGLRQVLDNLPELSVVSEASNIAQITAGEADVLVVASPANFVLRENSVPILLLTDEPDDIHALLNAGLRTWGALPVDASEDELGAAVRALAEGLWVGAPVLLRGLFALIPSQEIDQTAFTAQALTARETEVLQLTAQGLANKQIAVNLGISEHTVKFHLSSLYAKLDVTNRTEAVRAGARQGLIVF